MKVFVSSTVYDLVDLRAELYEFFRNDLRMNPMMSDFSLSAFDISQAKNNLETCLINVRSCDIYCIVLSQRYGSIIPDLDPEFSVTHLEYLEAKKAHKRILFFVRDKLEADYRTWLANKKAPELKLVWLQSGEDKLLEIIEDFERSADGRNRSNWIITFKNIVDLKAALLKELKSDSRRAALRTRIEKSNLPVIDLKLDPNLELKNENLSLDFVWTNVGNDLAYKIKILGETTADLNGVIHETFLLAKGAAVKTSRMYDLGNNASPIQEPFEVEYYTVEGNLITDSFQVEITWHARQPSFVRMSSKLIRKTYKVTNEEVVEIIDEAQ